MSDPRRPLQVALFNDYDLVLQGLAAMLAPYDDRLVVVELSTDPEVRSTPDLILIDTFARREGTAAEVQAMRSGEDTKVVIYSWHTSPQVIDSALARGADGYLTKGTPSDELVAALERVAAGELVRPERPAGPEAEDAGDWPGHAEGLTAREAEVVALIAQGLSNREIASQIYLSVNSIKSHIRAAYRKMGVTRRSQAVVWATRHGFVASYGGPGRTVSAPRG
jgi:NarL family two-component system response regulator LiaR